MARLGILAVGCSIAIAIVAFMLDAIKQRRDTETQMSDARDRSMRVEFCTHICNVQEQEMLGVAEDPEWRCFCKDGYLQPLP
jgi:hypothetical protein